MKWIIRILYALFCLWGLYACGGPGGHVEAEKLPRFDFLMNGEHYPSDYVGEPTPLDPDVLQLREGQSLRLNGTALSAIDKYEWWIAGDRIPANHQLYTHNFQEPGLYPVKLCQNEFDCVTKYVNVVRTEVISEVPIQLVEEQYVESPSAVPARPSKIPTDNRNDNKKEVSTGSISTPKEPVNDKANDQAMPLAAADVSQKPMEVLKPDDEEKVYRTRGLAGIALSAYAADCVEWVKSASVRIKVLVPLELDAAVVFGSHPGRVKITLSDDAGNAESAVKILSRGRSQFTFDGLFATLIPGRIYTLRLDLEPEAGGGETAGIANILECDPASGSNQDIELLDGKNKVLFDLKYRKK